MIFIIQNSNAKQFIYGTESPDLSCVTFEQ